MGSGVGRAIWEQFYFQLFQNSGYFAWSSVRCCLCLLRQRMILRNLFCWYFKIMRHAKLCLSVIMFLICVCWHPERMCRALSTCGQRGQVWLFESLNNTACFWLYRVPVLYFIMIHLVLKGHLMMLAKGSNGSAVAKPCLSCTSKVLVEHAWCAKGSGLS